MMREAVEPNEVHPRGSEEFGVAVGYRGLRDYYGPPTV